MAFNPLMALIAAEVAQVRTAGWSVAELGNQRFKVDNQTLERIARRFEAASDPARARAVRELAALDTKARIPLVARFFTMIGASRYVAIDVNERFDSIAMDLNKSLRRDYQFTDQFDVVINNGTGEHIFDQRAVFENMHDLCRAGGMMINVLPFASYLNHGFFSFHPTLFLDLAAANDYEILGVGAANGLGMIGFMSGPMSRGLIEGENIPLETMKKPIEGRDVWGAPPLRWVRRALARHGYYKMPKIRLDLAMERVIEESCRRDRKLFGNVLSISLMRKRGEDAFKIPFQGRFVPNIQDADIAGGYNQATVTRKAAF